MKCIKTEDAVGHVLCHDMTQIIPGVSKGPRFCKGHIVTAEDIPVLLSVGKGKIFYGKNITGHSLVTPKLMTIMIASSTAKLRLNHDCFVVVIVSTSIHL